MTSRADGETALYFLNYSPNRKRKTVKKPVILCVDDERTLLSSLKKELKGVLGDEYLIELAEGSDDALELMDELQEDGHELPLVISDYIMPYIKGDELLIRIHQKWPSTRKVMLTGQADISAVGNAVNLAGLYRYIAKPWQADDLKLTVTEAIRSFYQDKQLEQQHLTMEQMNQELLALNKAYSRFVPQQFLSLLDKNSILDIELGMQTEREMTILFSDIRGFTSFSETMGPQENFDFLNTYLCRMEPVIDAHGGFVDKYIGDAIMALFPCDVNQAVQGAVNMLQELKHYNKERLQTGLEQVRIGIGLNTGAMMLGTVGGKNRMDGTVISDAVNIASRIENLTKVYGVNLLITEQTYQRLEKPREQFNIRLIDSVQVKGKRTRITVYEVFDADEKDIIELKSKTQKIFTQGLKRYHNRDFAGAREYFEQVLETHAEDSVAKIYLTRCQLQKNYAI